MADENLVDTIRPKLEESKNMEIMPNQYDKVDSSEKLIDDDQINEDLVLDVFIQNTTDVEFLKKCRLTNKHWNFKACSRLQTVSIITISEYPEYFDQLKDLLYNILLARSFGFSSVSSPFKYVNVISDNFSIEDFTNLVLSPYIRSTHCSLKFFKGSINSKIPNFLKLNQAYITDFTIERVHSGVMLKILGKIKFTSLKKLVLTETCYVQDGKVQDCRHVEALKKSLQVSALSSLDIKMKSSNCFFSFLNMNLSQLTELRLEMNNVGNQCWNALVNLQLPCLKRLYVSSDNTEDGAFTNQLNSFLGNVASSLRKLEHDLTGELEMNFMFVNLYCLKIPVPSLTQLQKLLTPERFPKLRNIWLTFATLESMKFAEPEFCPHRGIKKCGVVIEEAVVLAQLDAIFPIWLINLRSLFPNIKDLGFYSYHASWTSSCLLYMHSMFPQLKTIRIYSPFDFLTLAGASAEQIHEFARIGLPIQRIPRRNSLFDFKNLEKLVLDPESSVSNDIIQHCLSLLPKLNRLRISWNSDLSTEVFGNSFQHLSKLEIYSPPPNEWKNEVSELSRKLPTCTVHHYPWI